jgi:hypothetical protein
MKQKIKQLLSKAPRDLKTIKAELSQVTLELGNAEYNLYAFNEEKNRLVKRSKELNLEGRERIDLDKAVAAQQEQEKAKTEGEVK